MPTNNARFTVVYDGPALRDSQMDVRDLAPALLGLGEVLEQANRVLNGERATLKVHVKAFKGGCFGIDLELIQSCIDTVLGWLTPGSEVRNGIDLLNVVGFTPREIVTDVGIGLYLLIKMVKGRRPKKKIELENGRITLVFDSPERDEEITVDKDVVELYENVKVREAAEKSVSPLEHAGIDSFGIVHDGERRMLVTKKDVDSFRLSNVKPLEIPIDTSDQIRVLSIVSLSFKQDNKWRLSDGQAILNVKINDDHFLKEVNEGASFAKGDMLKVQLVSKASVGHDGLKTEYEVTKVIEHIKQPRQLWLLDNTIDKPEE